MKRSCSIGILLCFALSAFWQSKDGVDTLKTDLKNKTVIIEYDAEKTNVQNIIRGFKKIKYEATEVKQ